jgi:ParB family chromosome partitioning protein
MNKPDNSRKALGKGLGALLPSRTTAVAEVPAPAPERAQEVVLDLIDPNPIQPRRTFAPEKLEELAQSIKSNGIIQPLVVRKTGDRFQLVAGERRLRAAKLAAMKTVPVVVREISDDRLLEVTLIENIQREDLNPIETGQAFSKMSTLLNLSAEAIGQRTGKDRTTVTNFIRILQLQPEVLELVSEGRLTAGHGRALLIITDPASQCQVAQQAAEQNWSVRQIERVAQRMMEGRKPKKLEEIRIDPNVKAAIQALEQRLGTKVRIHEGARGKGRIEIDYYSAEDLDRIYELIAREEA